jgi:hypothetical protein
MAIATTVVRPAFNTGFFGTINLPVVSTAGISSATPLTVAGELILTPVQELPFNVYKCKVTATPRGSGRLIIRIGDTVTG